MILRLTILFAVALMSFQAWAGNQDRAGQAGAFELLINPWARSSGWHGLNSATIHGIEAARINVAGLSFTEGTELVFANTTWMQGTDIQINSFGFSQSMGQDGSGGVLGITVSAMSFGDIEITREDQPEGGLGTYSPQFINFGLAYAKDFSRSIHGGIVVRGITEQMPDVTANGIALDAGIQYLTGPKTFPDKLNFGISLRNVGTPMRYSGDGLAAKRTSPNGDYEATLSQRSERLELPSLLHIGIGYNMILDGDKKTHFMTIVGNFTSNAFDNDQFGLGAEYSYKKWFKVRAGYKYAKDIFNEEERTTSITGFAAGTTLEVPLKKAVDKDESDSTFGLDYSYRTSNPFGGTHSIGIRFAL